MKIDEIEMMVKSHKMFKKIHDQSQQIKSKSDLEAFLSEQSPQK